MQVERLSSNKQFDCHVSVYSHDSAVLGCKMKFAVILPDTASDANKLPWIFFLSGLTCTEANFIQKAGAAHSAAKHQVAIVIPDTSPRGLGIPGEDDSWDFGTGAGFYLNATKAPYERYRMYDYLLFDLLPIVESGFPVVGGVRGVVGHSMGGHGALTLALKNPTLFKSVSAFSPISHPSECPWGQKAFSGYLGDDKEAWKEYDATELIKGGAAKGAYDEILIDVGDKDEFLERELKIDHFEAACADAGQKVTVRRQPGYDHSYFFISTFIEDHVAFHAKHLH